MKKYPPDIHFSLLFSGESPKKAESGTDTLVDEHIQHNAPLAEHRTPRAEMHVHGGSSSGAIIHHNNQQFTPRHKNQP